MDCTHPNTLEAAQAAFDNAEAGITLVNGKPHYTDGKGRLVPVEMVKDADRLEDQAVRKIIGFAEPLAAQVSRFRQHCFDDVDTLLALLDEQYNVKRGGQKGNLTLTSYDGLFKVQVAIGETITYGPSLQTAKALVDEYLTEKTAAADPELRTLIDHAFQVDKEGKINRAALLGLRRLNITDDRWVRAMQAVADAEKVLSTKRYVRCYRRDNADANWSPIVIDVAA